MAQPLPSVHVVGTAESDVVPDRVVVEVHIATPVMATAAEALALGVERRARVRAALAAGAPEATVSDARVTTQADSEQVEDTDARGRVTTRWVVRGHHGVCDLRVEDAAGRAAGLMGIAGAHPDVTAARPGFGLGRSLRRATDRALEQEAVQDALERAQGLAAAAGLRCGEVLAIGEPPLGRDPGAAWPQGPAVAYSKVLDAAGDLEESLGELVPEPVTVSASVPVSVALLPAGGPAG